MQLDLQKTFFIRFMSVESFPRADSKNAIMIPTSRAYKAHTKSCRPEHHHHADESEFKEEVDPLVETLFNPKSDLHNDVPHLQYIAAIESEKVCQ